MVTAVGLLTRREPSGAAKGTESRCPATTAQNFSLRLGQPRNGRPHRHDAPGKPEQGAGSHPAAPAGIPPAPRRQIPATAEGRAETPVFDRGPRINWTRSTGQSSTPSVQPSGPGSVRLASSTSAPGSPQGLRGGALSASECAAFQVALARGSGRGCRKWAMKRQRAFAGGGFGLGAVRRCGPQPFTPAETVPVSAWDWGRGQLPDHRCFISG